VEAWETCPQLVSKPKVRVSIAIPSSILETEPDLRGKTLKAGLIGRAASIFRVEEIHVYKRGETRNLVLLRKILEYMEAPPYLKKKLFGLDPDLRFAGLLPPLQAPHHPKTPHPARGECREGVIIGFTKKAVLVDAGIGKPIKVKGLGRNEAKKGRRVTVKIVDPEAGIGIPATPSGYWGYRVHTHSSLKSMLKHVGGNSLLIGTSRMGGTITEIAEELSATLRDSESTLILFGGPREGLQEIFEDEGVEQNPVKFTVNFAPNQGVRTIRTEEAVYITLGILNFLLHKTSPKAGHRA